METPTEKCRAKHEFTGAVCRLPVGHRRNHRGRFDHGIAQWPVGDTHPTPPPAALAPERLVVTAQHTLSMLLACKNRAPNEWNALVATPAGSWLRPSLEDLRAAIDALAAPLPARAEAPEGAQE
jgi:hypothetical protein